jgi:uncharacterized protein
VEPGRIGGIGLSVGGETFLQTAARGADVKAVVSEGATARSGSELASVPGGQFAPVLFNRVATAGTAVFSNSSPPEHLIDQVDEIAPRAVLFIYAPEVDNGDEQRFNRAYYREARAPKAIWGCPRRVTSARRRRGRWSTSGASRASSTGPSSSQTASAPPR